MVNNRGDHPLHDLEDGQHQIQAIGHSSLGQGEADKELESLFGAFGLHEGATGLDHTGCEEEHQQPVANGLQGPVNPHHHSPYLAILEGLRTLGQKLPDLSQLVIPGGQSSVEVAYDPAVIHGASPPS